MQPHLQQMWEMTMRAMDDVKESCRAAAATMRTLQSVSLRLADPSATAPADAAQTVDLLLPFLLDRCARQPCPTISPSNPISNMPATAHPYNNL